MDQLTDLLAGASVALDDDVLDRIDQIVPPGVTLNTADAGWQPPALTDPAARRRPQATRAARLGGSRAPCPGFRGFSDPAGESDAAAGEW